MEISKNNITNIETQLATWNTKLEEMVTATKKAGAETKPDYSQRLADVRSKHTATQAKVAELKSANADAGNAMKPGLEKAWSELDAAFQKLSH